MTYTGEKLTESFEGCRLTAYQDVGGVWTIGYGHTKDVKEGDIISLYQAEQFLISDIGWAENVVNDLVTVPLNQDEFNALVDFVFNLGEGNFEKSTLVKLLNNSDYQGATDEFIKWDRAGGKVVVGLLRRRIAEKNEFIDGTEVSS